MDGASEFLFNDWLVDLAQQLCRARRVGSDDDPVGVKKIFDRCSFPEKFRIGRNIILQPIGAMYGEMLAQLRTSLNRHGALLDDQAVARRTLGNGSSHAFD